MNFRKFSRTFLLKLKRIPEYLPIYWGLKMFFYWNVKKFLLFEIFNFRHVEFRWLESVKFCIGRISEPGKKFSYCYLRWNSLCNIMLFTCKRGVFYSNVKIRTTSIKVSFFLFLKRFTRII